MAQAATTTTALGARLGGSRSRMSGRPRLLTAVICVASAVAFCTSCARSVQVDLYHCGFLPLSYQGRIWEVPSPPPFDDTNAPSTWQGRGVVTQVTDSRLVFRDESGVEVVFVPDDGIPPPACD